MAAPVRDGHGTRASRRRRSRDRGQTFVEILVAIVLLGTAVSGTLTALRTTIISSKVDEDQAKAQAWLQAAADAIQRTEYKPCPSYDVAQVKGLYDDAVQDVVDVPPPPGWEAGSIGVTEVEFWSKSNGNEIWGAVCGTPMSAQRVEIYVLSPTGDLGKSLQVIKRGG
jgi:type II secretory pathway pseudopilin PulG